MPHLMAIVVERAWLVFASVFPSRFFYQGTLLMMPPVTRITNARPMITDHQSSLICFHQGFVACIPASLS